MRRHCCKATIAPFIVGPGGLAVVVMSGIENKVVSGAPSGGVEGPAQAPKLALPEAFPKWLSIPETPNSSRLLEQLVGLGDPAIAFAANIFEPFKPQSRAHQPAFKGIVPPLVGNEERILGAAVSLLAGDFYKFDAARELVPEMLRTVRVKSTADMLNCLEHLASLEDELGIIKEMSRLRGVSDPSDLAQSLFTVISPAYLPYMGEFGRIDGTFTPVRGNEWKNEVPLTVNGNVVVIGDLTRYGPTVLIAAARSIVAVALALDLKNDPQVTVGINRSQRADAIASAAENAVAGRANRDWPDFGEFLNGIRSYGFSTQDLGEKGEAVFSSPSEADLLSQLRDKHSPLLGELRIYLDLKAVGEFASAFDPKAARLLFGENYAAVARIRSLAQDRPEEALGYLAERLGLPAGSDFGVAAGFQAEVTQRAQSALSVSLDRVGEYGLPLSIEQTKLHANALIGAVLLGYGNNSEHALVGLADDASYVAQIGWFDKVQKLNAAALSMRIMECPFEDWPELAASKEVQLLKGDRNIRNQQTYLLAKEEFVQALELVRPIFQTCEGVGKERQWSWKDSSSSRAAWDSDSRLQRIDRNSVEMTINALSCHGSLDRAYDFYPIGVFKKMITAVVSAGHALNGRAVAQAASSNVVLSFPVVTEADKLDDVPMQLGSSVSRAVAELLRDSAFGSTPTERLSQFALRLDAVVSASPSFRLIHSSEFERLGPILGKAMESGFVERAKGGTLDPEKMENTEGVLIACLARSLRHLRPIRDVDVAPIQTAIDRIDYHPTRGAHGLMVKIRDAYIAHLQLDRHSAESGTGFIHAGLLKGLGVKLSTS